MKDLLDKYWKGETSLEEERQLKEWLKDEDNAARYKQLAELFSWYEQESKVERQAAVVPMTAPKTRSLTNTPLFKWAVGIAASFILLLGIWINSTQKSLKISKTDLAFVDTYDEPEEAYEEAQKALVLLSTKLNTTSHHQKNLKKISILTDIIKPQE